MTTSIGILELKNYERDKKARICLSNSAFAVINSGYTAIISGSPLMNFTVSITFASHRIELGKEKSFRGPKLFFFSTANLTNPNARQLDITVKSTGNGNASLRVSSFCDQIVKRAGVVNSEKRAISLTFRKQGRITISRVSKPPLYVSPLWFIGVISVDTEEDSINNKNFTINITRSFDYDYTAPLCFIVFVPAIGGVIVALWALYCFREPLDLAHDLSCSSSLHGSSASSYHVSKASSLAFWSSKQPNELTPLVRQPHLTLKTTKKEILKAMYQVLKYHWFGEASKAFSYITCVVGFVLFIGGFQFVYEDWNIMVEQGDRDKCFYDDLCYRVSPYSDIPFNLMISNLAYIVHGIILAIAVWVMEAELYLQAKKKAALDDENKNERNASASEKESLPQHTLICRNINAHLPELSVPVFKCSKKKEIIELYARAYKRKYSFSVGYSFAWALIFEGLFSLTYHLCPSRVTFQFDTAFMFVIAGLIIVSLFNGFSVRGCHEEEGIPKPLEDTAFYLFAIVPLYFLNYLGSVYNTGSRTNNLVKIVFVTLMVLWYLAMLGWSAGRVLYSTIRHNGLRNCDSVVKLVLFCLTIICTCVVFPILFYKDFSHLFLFSSITIAVISIIGKIILKAFKAPPERYSTFKVIVFKVVQVLYVVVALGVMVGAVYVFDGIPTTEKTSSPGESRNLNKDCAFLGFYDFHDIWHIMSSFALLMGSFLVMYISE